MNIKANMVPVIDFEEIRREMELAPEKFYFFNNAETRYGYFWLNTDEDAIPELEWAIECENEYAKTYNTDPDEDLIQTIRNQITLVNELRELGYEDDVLIYIWD